MEYFEHHYALVNDLSPEGRRRTWFDLDRLYGRWLPSDRAVRILDFGCGAGVLLEWLRDGRGYTSALGVDVSQGQVDFATRLGLHVVQRDDPLEWLETQEPFDLILLIDVLEHLSDDDAHATLRAVSTSLRPGGRLVIRVPNANASFASRYRYIDATHQRSYTEISLLSSLRAAGFEEVAIAGDDVWAVRSIAGLVRLFMRAISRFVRRCEAVGEFGPAGLRLPLSLNLLATARRTPA